MARIKERGGSFLTLVATTPPRADSEQAAERGGVGWKQQDQGGKQEKQRRHGEKVPHFSPLVTAVRSPSQVTLLLGAGYGTTCCMLQSYVGIISQRGLEVFCSETPDAVQFLRRRAARNPSHKVCFWSIVPDDAVQQVQSALRQGRFADALSLVEQHSREYGLVSPRENEFLIPVYL